MINFDHFEYKFDNDNLNSLRYVDYKINIIPKLENDIDLKFSKNIYDLSFKKDELLELDVYLNGNECYLYDMNIFDKTGNISGYINNDGKIVLSAVNTGNYEIELSLNIGFKQIQSECIRNNTKTRKAHCRCTEHRVKFPSGERYP